MIHVSALGPPALQNEIRTWLETMGKDGPWSREFVGPHGLRWILTATPDRRAARIGNSKSYVTIEEPVETHVPAVHRTAQKRTL